MGVGVDQAGRHDHAMGVDGALGAHRRLGTDIDDFVAGDRDIAGKGLGGGSVIDRAAGDQHIGLLSLARGRAGDKRAQRR